MTSRCSHKAHVYRTLEPGSFEPLNMIVHRDYRASADSIVKIYNNRIEFFNPGRLPDTISIQDLMSNHYKSTPRNKLIADVFKSLGLVEKYGSGIRRIMEHFMKYGLPAPVFQNISDGFMVTVFGKKTVEKTVEKTDGFILDILRGNPTITIAELQKRLKLTRRGAEWQIKSLKEKGLLKRIGSDKNGHWLVENVTDKVTDKVTDNQRSILKELHQNGQITTAELATVVGISQRKIKENLNKLKELRLIERIGSAKGGHWLLLDEATMK